MRRKRFQRGSLSTRKRKGRNYWYAQWREEGCPKSKEIGLCSKMTRVEAGAKLAEIMVPVNAGAGKAEAITWTFAKFCRLVYLPVCQAKWKKSTGMTETNRLEFHLIGTLGDRCMEEITREELQSFLDCKALTNGRSMVDHLRFRLRSIFAFAISEGVVDRNPATELFTPRVCKEARAHQVLSPDQAIAMIGALDLREKVIARLAIWEGMRPGEILSLQVGDLDQDSVWVRRRLYRGNLDDPKSKRSARRVALSIGTVSVLVMWLTQLEVADRESWLFPSESGKPIARDNVWRRYMQPKLKAVRLEWATFQVMRRTFATLSKQAGVDAHTRSAQMGNTVDVNENEYAVASFEQKLAAVRRLESAVIQ